MNLATRMLNARLRSEQMLDDCRKAASLRPSASVGQLVGGNFGLRVGAWQDSDGNAGQAAEQYRHFYGHVYTAITAIAKKVAGQKVFVGRAPQLAAGPRTQKSSLGEMLEPLAAHPLLDVLADPNPLMTSWQMKYATICSLQLTGRSYWWLLRGENSRPQIWPIPATWVRAGNSLRTYFEVRPLGQVEPINVPGDQLAYFCLPDPANPFGSHSPLQSQALAIDVDEAIQQSQSRSFRNPHPGLILSAGRMPDPQNPGKDGRRPNLTVEQRNQLIHSILSVYSGVQNYGHPIILDGLIDDVRKLSNTPAEMDFLGSGTQTRARIFQAYGVNPLIVGEILGANRAQAVVAEQNFVGNVINPLLMLLSEVLTEWVGPWFSGGEKLQVWFEPAVANDPELRQKSWELGARFGIVTTNEIRRGLLNLPDVPGGDELIKPPAPVAPASDAPPEDDVLPKSYDPEWNPYTLRGSDG